MKNEKIALVTGASSGFGEEIARQLVKAGKRVWLVARREQRLQKLAAEWGELARYSVLDISNTAAIADFFNSNIEELKDVDMLINNAGLAAGIDPFDRADLADYDTMIDVNVRGLIHMTRHLLPLMIEQEFADIVNVGSVSGRWVYPNGSVYCATKYAVRAISEGLRMDLLGKNIRVANIEPGMADTEFSLVRLKDEGKAKAVYQGVDALSAADVADCVLWALTRPRHVNIQEIVVFPQQQASVGLVDRR